MAVKLTPTSMLPVSMVCFDVKRTGNGQYIAETNGQPGFVRGMYHLRWKEPSRLTGFHINADTIFSDYKDLKLIRTFVRFL